MKLLVLFLVGLAGLALAHVDDDREHLVNENRVPKMPAFTSVCTECKTLIQRIVEVAQDPAKLAELKILLTALCHETSYEDECRVFVSKLDFFIKELLPYLVRFNFFKFQMFFSKTLKPSAETSICARTRRSTPSIVSECSTPRST